MVARERYGVSVRFARHCLDISVATYYYRPKLSAENQRIADWLLRLTTANKRWGFGLSYLYLRNVKSSRFTENSCVLSSVPLIKYAKPPALKNNKTNPKGWFVAGW